LDLFLAILPILLLIVLLSKPKPWASHTALPFAALVLYLVKLVWFQAHPNTTNATVILGLLEALTPISIIFGAIFLFKTMELTGKMDVIRTWLNGISDNRVAQLMIIGWAFAFLIEGASGFGTPAALAAPLLVGLGFPPIRVAILTLIMNSVPVSFGAVGTPTWFGFAQVGLENEALQRVAFQSAVIHVAAALIVPILALVAVVPWRTLRDNLLFVYLSILSCTIPYGLLAAVDYEFPALVGGAIGLGTTVWLAERRIGLDKAPHPRLPSGAGEQVASRALLSATFPLWGTILILLVTRIEQLGLKRLLNVTDPAASISLGTLGDLSISPALVIGIENVFGIPGGDGAWSYRTLYVPALIPFFVVSFSAFALFRVERTVVRRVVRESWHRMVHPMLALLGALVMVRLLMTGGEDALVLVIGRSFAAAAGEQWPWFAPFLGALGSFFSGSATISNLTFGGIQSSIAENLGRDVVTMLALQSVGAAAGNMICINNIVAVCSILGIANQEGTILKRTLMPMIIYGLIAALVSLPLTS
jgi:lactate permease